MSNALAEREDVGEDTLVLIDLSAIFWSAWHATADQDVSGAFQATVAAVHRVAAKGDRVAVCCDSGRSWRKDIAPEYKAQRPEKDHASLGELDRVQARLRQDGFLLWSAPGMEADDIIASATTQALADTRFRHVLIASADKDLMQLVCDRVTVLSTRTWTELGPAEVREKFGVPPEKLGGWLALVGDKSDNIPGIPGIGPKKAADLLTRFGDVDGVFRAAMAEDESIKPKCREAIVNGEAALALAQRLVALRADVPVDVGQVFEKRNVEPLQETPTMEQLDGTEIIDPPPAPAPEPTPAPQAQTALSIVRSDEPRQTAMAPVRYDQALEPTSLGAAMKLASALFNSRLYSKHQNPESILAIIVRGREMGLGALTALDCFQIVDNRPVPTAHFIIAKAKAHPDCEYLYCVETNAERATWETKNRRSPAPVRLTYTIEEARIAGMIKEAKGDKDANQWVKRAPEMLRKTAGVFLARMEYPDAALGLYAAEELGADVE